MKKEIHPVAIVVAIVAVFTAIALGVVFMVNRPSPATGGSAAANHSAVTTPPSIPAEKTAPIKNVSPDEQVKLRMQQMGGGSSEK